MKRRTSILSLILSFVMCLGIATTASAVENDTQIRILDVENDLVEYLEIYHPDIVWGSNDFIEYAVDILMYDADDNLVKLENYDDVRFYLGEYLYQLDKYQAENSGIMTYSDVEETVYVLPEEYKMLTINELKEEIANKMQEEKNNFLAYEGIAAYSSYNASAAVAYARQYALSYNSSFNLYSKDCTNFVSQAVYNGGIPMDKPSTIFNGVYETTDYWYTHLKSTAVSPDRTSTSWTNVDDFASYAVYQVGAYMYYATSFNDLQQKVRIGDIVQICDASGNWYHSVIITGTDEDGYTYSAHSNNRRDASLSKLSTENRWRIIRF